MQLLRNIRGTIESYNIDRYPDQCPICHNGIQPTYVDAAMKNYDTLQVVFLCPIQRCRSYFIGIYAKAAYRDLSGIDFYLHSLTPYHYESENFSEIISDLSPDFCRIYNQARYAEQLGLDQICGPGYRKSLEYLVKDYLIKISPQQGNAIESMFLGKCIRTYIADSKVRACAERAAWLGNDETHYIRKWVGKDLEDLKVLIRLTVNFVESDLLASKYNSEMNLEGSSS